MRFQAIAGVVVLIIVGIGLAALYFPAIQAAREASRRTQCGNHVQHLVLGLQNYHDTFLYLPYGARNRTVPPDYKQPSWGPSWLVPTIPYCGINRGYQAICDTDAADPLNDGLSTPMRQECANVARFMRYMNCPSSPLPDGQRLNGVTLLVPSYAGIMGATDDPGSSLFRRTVAGPYGGWASANGMLVVNDCLTFAACTDGTANTIIVGEVADWYYTDSGQPRNPALSMGDAGDGYVDAAGWLAGTDLPTWVPSEKYDPNSDEDYPGYLARVMKTAPAIPADRVCNLITIAHPVGMNNRLGLKDNAPNWGTQGTGRCGLNNPLLSAHSAGAMVGYLDGHVVLLSKRMALGILKQQSCRDDLGWLGKD